jgi:hypothetical protein
MPDEDEDLQGYLRWQTESEDALKSQVAALAIEVERLRARIDRLEGKKASVTLGEIKWNVSDT